MPSTSFKFTVGEKIVTLYFCVFYFFPLIGNFLFSEQITSIYKIYPLSWFTALSLFATYFGFLFLSRHRLFDHIQLELKWLKRLADSVATKYLKYRLAIAIVFFVDAFLFISQELATYRYSHLSISERSSYLLMVSILITNVAILDLFYWMFVNRKENVKGFSKRWFENVLMASSLLLLADGTATAFLALQMGFYAFFPSLFQRLWFAPARESLSVKIKRYGKLAPLCALTFALSWGYGESIKNQAGKQHQNPPAATAVNLERETPKSTQTALWGLIEYDPEAAQERRRQFGVLLEKAKDKIDRLLTEGPIGHRTSGQTLEKPDEVIVSVPGVSKGESILEKLERKWNTVLEGGSPLFSKQFLYYITERLSVHYYSFLFTSNVSWDELHLNGAHPILMPIRTFFFRVDTLLGRIFGIQRPEVGSVSQLNYRLLAKQVTNLREGSSPGPIGSATYAMPFPFSIILSILYLAILSRVFTTLLGSNENLEISVLGIFLATNILMNFFESPLDVFLVVDNNIFRIALVIGIFFAVRRPSVEGDPEALKARRPLMALPKQADGMN